MVCCAIVHLTASIIEIHSVIGLKVNSINTLYTTSHNHLKRKELEDESQSETCQSPGLSSNGKCETDGKDETNQSKETAHYNMKHTGMCSIALGVL